MKGDVWCHLWLPTLDGDEDGVHPGDSPAHPRHARASRAFEWNSCMRPRPSSPPTDKGLGLVNSGTAVVLGVGNERVAFLLEEERRRSRNGSKP